MKTIQSELKRNKLSQKEEQPKSKKKNEQFTRRQIEQLMGVNRDTFKRVNGAIRRK